jgi:hypothetical protein
VQLESNGVRDIISSLGLFNDPFRFTISLPVPILLCLHLSFPLPILCTLLFPDSFVTALCLLLNLTVTIFIPIARTAPATDGRSGFRAVVIILILVKYLIPIQWANVQEVAWLVLPAAWWLNHCPEIIVTVPRKMLPSVFNIPQAGCLHIGAAKSIPEGTRVVLSPMVHLATGLVEHLTHV